MEEYIYTGTITLTPCADWVISWDDCCRNAAITNLVSPSSYGTTLRTTLNSITAPCDNSPEFTAQPIPYVCLNQLVVYTWGVIEQDGDSLTYSLISAINENGNAMTYVSPYSASNPINGITINNSTGQITFTPTSIGDFVVVVQVNQYDSVGNLIGTSVRDIEFVVQNCSNQIPPANQGYISGLTGTANQTGNYSLELCDGGSFNFSVSISDPDAGDTVNLTSNIATELPGATFNTTAGNPATATVSWTASGGTAFFNNFTIFADDGACPIPGIQSFVYSVTVIPGTVASPATTILCGSQWAPLVATGGSNFVWSVLSGDSMILGTNFSCDSCSNPLAKPSVTTIYQVTSDLITSGCVNTRYCFGYGCSRFYMDKISKRLCYLPAGRNSIFYYPRYCWKFCLSVVTGKFF